MRIGRRPESSGGRGTLCFAPATRRLQQSEDFENLRLLQECDARGRVPGAIVCELAKALAFIKALAVENDD